MRRIKEKLKTVLNNKCGMTLTELLVAMTLLAIVSLCFLPLFQTYYGNISTVGQVSQENYKSEGLVEKLIGMKNNHIKLNEYSTETADIPLTMTVDELTIASKNYGLSKIAGDTISSVPENLNSGYNTFLSNSVTSKMVCYPKHISDDFLEKDIILYAAGFDFTSESKFSFYVTNSQGNLERIPQTSSDGKYYKIEIGKDSHIATLTLKGDNDVICFEKSPLVIRYDGYNYDFPIEIDAPAVVMVGETGSDGYYFVSSGEIDKDGNLSIIRKQMNSIDQHNGSAVKLNSAMNDVTWVPVGQGDNGAGGTNTYGYYIMCGDEGQIRRFWKNTTTGNYYWGGDYTTPYKVDSINDSTLAEGASPDKIVGSKTYGTSVNTSYAYVKDPNTGKGQNLTSAPNPAGNSIVHPDYFAIGAYDTLFTQTAFSVNALVNKNINVYTTGNVLFSGYEKYNFDASEDAAVDNKYVISNTDGWYDRFVNNNGAANIYNNEFKNTGNVKLKNSVFTLNSSVMARSANEMKNYTSYTGKSTNVTLTSADSIKMLQSYTSDKYPTNSYTLYCGYIPGVMDIWTREDEGNSSTTNQSYAFSRWRATLGLAFTDSINKSYYSDLGYLFKGYVTQALIMKYGMYLHGNLWEYSKVPTTSYAISGVCSPTNYSSSNSFLRTNEAVAAAQYSNGRNVYPLNVYDNQQQLQNQNNTVISFSYFSHPYAFADANIQRNYYDLSSARKTYDGVIEWCFDDSLTIMDMDNIYYEYYDNATQDLKENYYSIAVGYVVAGLLYQNQSSRLLSVPTVMNNGIVYLRAGGANNEAELSSLDDTTTSAMLDQESNIFHQFYYTDVYNVTRNVETINGKNTLLFACSANYWRDAYHPMFYSTYGGYYNPDNDRDRFSYIMSHVLMDKRLTCTAWGYTWQNAPEVMWGASDGTLMSWYLDTYDLENKPKKITAKSTSAEFQSYQELKYANEHNQMFGTTKFYHRWVNASGVTWFDTDNYFNLPLNWNDMGYNSAVDGDLDGTIDGMNSSPTFGNTTDAGRGFNGISGYFTDESGGKFKYSNNSYWDKCSVLLECAAGNNASIISDQTGSNSGYGMISPLDSINDVCYANDIWIAGGVQGLANPFSGKVGTETVYYCQKGAITGSGTGSWVCVRSWFDQSKGVDKGPCENNNNYLWHVVKISSKENCNIQQVTYTNGIWYAVGYIDANDNGSYDAGEKAVVFYAKDPTKDCSQDGGWKLSDPDKVGYTQCWANENGNYVLKDIFGINAVASRND